MMLMCTFYDLFVYTYAYREEVQEPELVYAKVANVEIPQMVIKFYESKLTWHEHLGESLSLGCYSIK